MADPVEIILEVPKEVVENCNGFSMDFGSSAVKLVYLHKDDWEELQSQDPSVKTAKLRLRSYARPDYKEAFDLLKQSCYISRGSEETLIYTTGIGCFEFSENINKTMNVRIKNTCELACLVKGFHYLSGRIPRQQLEYAQSENLKAQLRVMQEEVFKMMDVWQQVVDAKQTRMALPHADLVREKMKTAEPELASDKPVATTLPEMFPCILAQAGSAVSFILVNADGSCKIMDVNCRGGRSFLGLGSLLVGKTTNYSKLMELAAKGNSKNVDTFKNDFRRKDRPPSDKADAKDEDMYSKRINDDDFADEIVFSYGKAASAQTEPFKTEDVIRAVLNASVMDLVQNLQLLMITENISRCFLCGSFIKHQLVRDMISLELQRRVPNSLFLNRVEPLDFRFLRVGPHLAALGALLNYTDDILEASGSS